MTRLILLCSLIMILLAGLAVSASANSSTAPSWQRIETSLATYNDLQSTTSNRVVNTTGCVWANTDDLADEGIGRLAAGGSSSDSLCVVTDYCTDSYCPHMIVVDVNSSTSSVRMTLSNDRGGSWSVPAPVRKSNNLYSYQLCIADPLWTGDTNPADYPAIPGTNGGVGFVTTYTLTMTAAKVSQVYAEFEIAPNHSDGSAGYYRVNPNVVCPAVNG